MQMSLRLMRVMRIFVFAVSVVFILLPEWSHPHPDHSPSPVFFFTITGMACADVAIAFFIHRMIIRRATPILTVNPEDKTALNRWRGAFVIAFAFATAIGLFGLVLRFIGFSLGQVTPFYVAGIGMLLYFNPRAPIDQNNMAGR